MTSDAAPRARDLGQQSEVAGFYDQISMLLAELIGGSLHQGYWESASDGSSMVEASERLTDVMVGKIGVGPGDRVLDVGCGTGGPAVRLAGLTGAVVVGVTNSVVQAGLARERACGAGLAGRVTFRCEDASVLAFAAGSFDAVWMIESISHLPDRLGALREVARVLKPGGRVAITDLLDRTPAPDTLRKAVGDLDEHATSHGYSPLMAQPIRLPDYESLLVEAGLIPTELADVSEHTVSRTLACMRQKLVDDRDELVRKFGSRAVEQYESVLPLLESAGFGYAIVVANAPKR